MPAVAVVGHVEWVRFALVGHVPAPGEIVEADGDFALAAGGGAVAAAQLARLAGSATFFTALGSDAPGEQAGDQLRGLGIDLRAARREAPQRWAFTHLSADSERTITVVGERHVPHGSDDLGWEALEGADAVYFTGGDAAALRHARRARILVVTARALAVAAEAALPIDVLVGSARDAGERYERGGLRPEPGHVVRTDGRRGGGWEAADGGTGSWAPAEPPGPPVDAYGCGDSFAAGLTYGLAVGLGIEQALAGAARCGAAVLCGRGPYEGQPSVL